MHENPTGFQILAKNSTNFIPSEAFSFDFAKPPSALHFLPLHREDLGFNFRVRIRVRVRLLIRDFIYFWEIE